MLTRTDEGYKSIIVTLLPVIQKLLVDNAPEVREVAAESLPNVAKLLNPKDLGEYVLTIVLSIFWSKKNRLGT